MESTLAMAASDQPISEWIHQLKDGQSLAAERIWEEYFERLVSAASRKFGAASRRVADEEDVAVGAMKSLCLGAQQGRFPHLSSRKDLWMLLMTLTGQKIVDQIRSNTRQKRGGGAVRGESVFLASPDRSVAGIARFAVTQESPEFLVEMEEEHSRLMGLLPEEQHREIARMKLSGETNEHIAEQLEISIHSVGRKVKLIRRVWAEELGV